ncbi:MAG: efflux RND transporter periplasmic adaptor subunit [Candidatus Cryptobacteroides sp.]
MGNGKIVNIGFALIILTGIAASSCRNGDDSSLTDKGMEYPTLEVELTDKVLSTVYSASIKGRQDVEIRPQISGLITGIHVTEGQNVSKGQPLFTLDQVACKAAVETARADVRAAAAEVELAGMTVDSKQELHNSGVVSEFDLKTAQNQLEAASARLAQAEAKLVNAENDLSYTIVRSPSDGVVGTLPYRIGSLVSPSTSTPLTTVSDNSEMFVYFSLSETQVLQMTEESGSLDEAVARMPELELKLSTGKIYAHKGKVETISGVIDRTTGSVSVRAVFPNKERKLLSGGSGCIVFPVVLYDVIVIPQSATYELQDRKFTYKVVDGIAVSTEISVYPENDGNTYVVTSGLSVGDVIVSSGAGLLKNGTVIVPADK